MKFNLMTWTNSIKKLESNKMKYFKLEEFDDDPGTGKNMKKDFLIRLEAAREEAQIPFIILSGWRSRETNERLIKEGYKAAKNSSHLAGVAADIKCTNSADREIIVRSLINAGFSRIGIADSYIHCDSDITKNSALWLY